jgi:tetratricopeptide (TPR) repeat protein
MDELLNFEQIQQDIEAFEEAPREAETDEAKKANKEKRSSLAGELIVKALYHYTFIEEPRWYDVVYKCLELAHDVDYNGSHAHYELGYYLLFTNEKEWALELLDDARYLVEKLPEEACAFYRAKTLSALFSYYFKEKDYAKAIEYDTEAVKLYTELALKDPAEYSFHLSESLKHLGMANVNNQNYSVGLVLFEENLRLQREIAAQADTNFPFRMETSAFEQFGDFQSDFSLQMNIAETLNTLGDIHAVLEEYPQAFDYYDQSIQILNANVDNNLLLVLHKKANILANVARIHGRLKDYEEALRCTKDAIACRKRLQDIDPFGQLPDLIALHELAVAVYFGLKSPDDAIHEQEKVIRLHRIIVKNHRSEQTLDDLGDALARFIEYCQNHHKWDKFIHAVREAEAIYRQQLSEFHADYNYALSTALISIFFYYNNIEIDRKKAVDAATEACQLMETFERNENTEGAYQFLTEFLKDK